METVPDLQDIPERLPAYKQPTLSAGRMKITSVAAKHDGRSVAANDHSASMKLNKNPAIMNLNTPVYIKCFNYTLDNR